MQLFGCLRLPLTGLPQSPQGHLVPCLILLSWAERGHLFLPVSLHEPRKSVLRGPAPGPCLPLSPPARPCGLHGGTLAEANPPHPGGGVCGSPRPSQHLEHHRAPTVMGVIFETLTVSSAALGLSSSHLLSPGQGQTPGDAVPPSRALPAAQEPPRGEHGHLLRRKWKPRDPQPAHPDVLPSLESCRPRLYTMGW